MKRLKSNEVLTIDLTDFAPRVIRLPLEVTITWPHGAWVTLTRQGEGYNLTWATGEQFIKATLNNTLICPGCEESTTKLYFSGDKWYCGDCVGILFVRPVQSIPDLGEAQNIAEVIKTLKHLL